MRYATLIVLRILQAAQSYRSSDMQSIAMIQ
jgi:hypothetical protein